MSPHPSCPVATYPHDPTLVDNRLKDVPCRFSAIPSSAGGPETGSNPVTVAAISGVPALPPFSTVHPNDRGFLGVCHVDSSTTVRNAVGPDREWEREAVVSSTSSWPSRTTGPSAWSLDRTRHGIHITARLPNREPEHHHQRSPRSRAYPVIGAAVCLGAIKSR